MEEDDLVAVLRGAHVHVDGFFEKARQLCDFKVVRRKEREGADRLHEFVADGACQRQPVEGRRAASDFVHQNEASVGRLMKNGGRLRHFDHEGRASAGEIVRSADAGVNAVDRTDFCALGRHEAPHPG